MVSKERGLLAKIQKKTATVAVLGLGYVGHSVVQRFAEVGFSVLGLDVDENKVATLKQADVGTWSGKKGAIGSIRYSTDFSLLKKADAAIICVPTPLSKTRDPDLSFVIDAARVIVEHLKAGQLIVLESTTYPGTTRELLLPVFEETGLKVGRDFFLGYSPERIDPGNPTYHLGNTPKVVAGVTDSCLNLIRELYSKIVDRVVPVSSTDSAEVVKLLENIFRSVNIALVNEFAMMCDRLGLDVWEVIEAATSKPFGFMPFFPGPGLGGHCIPVDPQYLSWKLKHLSYKARFVELADQINREMPHFVVDKVVEALNGKRKSVNGSKILVLGVSYKKDTSDVRESPALDVMELLLRKGGDVSYHDPYVRDLVCDGRALSSGPMDSGSLAGYDAVVILADHGSFNPRKIVDAARLVIDARNLTRGIKSDNIVRL